jgi:predicted small lipoprotein YifL
MTKYFINFFHTLIIAGFILSFSGCGYKGDPIYIKKDAQIEQNNKEVPTK